MAEGNMLILDAGTSRVKAGLIAPSGKLLGYTSKSLNPKSTKPGEAVTDPADVWATVRVLVKQLMKGIETESVDALSFTGNRISVSLADRNGTVLHPLITWLDSRSATKFDERIEEVDKRVILQKILWYKESRPDLYAKAASILNLDSYLNVKLVGKPVMWVHSAVYALYDPVKREWPDKLSEFGVDRTLLPEVLESGSYLGELTSEAAADLGLNKKTEVYLGMGDNQAGTVSVGALVPSDTKVGLSTGAYLDIVFDTQPFEFYHRAAKVFCHPYVEGKWLFEGVVPGSGLAYTWLGENFVPRFSLAASKGDDPYPELEKVAAMSPKGSDGLFTMPLFMFKRGMFWGLAYSHNASHLLRSVAESTAYGLRMFFDMAVNLGANPEFLRMDGSGSKSTLWKQTMCDVLHRSGSAVKNPEASPILGVAFLLMKSTGAIKDLSEASRVWSEKLEPSAENPYDPLYEQWLGKFLAEAAETPI